MRIRTLRSNDYFSPEDGFHCAFYRTSPTLAGLHRHDFHEFFYLISGCLCHEVAGREPEVLEARSLVLVRPEQAHRLMAAGDQPFHVVNIAFPCEVMADLDRFLLRSGSPVSGSGGPPSGHEPGDAPAPACTVLSIQDGTRLMAEIGALVALPRDAAERRRLQLRRIVYAVDAWTGADGLSRDRDTGTDSGADRTLPAWLSDLLRQVERKEVFLEGIPALLRLSGRSHGHLARTVRRLLDLSPSELVNRHRLDYASNLLCVTDLPVLDISLEAGFATLSHFNRTFRARFGTTPSRFRRAASLDRNRSLL